MTTRPITARLRRLAREPFARFGVAAIAVVATEIVGRRLGSDLYDLGLGILLAIAWSWLMGPDGRERVVSFAKRMKERVLHALSSKWSVSIGVDLRDHPPIAEGPIPIFHRLQRIAIGVSVASFVLAMVGTLAWRPVVTQACYLVHLTLLTALWCVLGFLLLGALMVAVLCIHDFYVLRHHDRRARRVAQGERSYVPEFLTHSVIGCLLIVLGHLMPVWVPVAITVAASLVGTAVLRRRNRLQLTLLWRPSAGGDLASWSWKSYVRSYAVVFAGLYVGLAYLGAGREVFGLASVRGDSLPLTTGLGEAWAWVGGLVITTQMLYLTVRMLQGERSDPARAYPTSICLAGGDEGREEATQRLRARGWRVGPGNGSPREDDVRLTLMAVMPPLSEQHPRWPMAVSAGALRAPEVMHIIARRDQVQRRRLLARGFESLFKGAAARSYDRGSGWFLAPHLWFSRGMARDDDDQDDYDYRNDPFLFDRVGLPYNHVFGRAARHHFYELMSTLEIDLLFVDDGIKYRAFRRVLRVFYEHFDVQRRAIDERHLVGIPGVRCVIHEYTLGNPYKDERYPEPDYDEIGRGRILHIFRDRGKEEEPLEVPTDWVGRPAPSPVLSF